jgi:hypothetical protein
VPWDVTILAPHPNTRSLSHTQRDTDASSAHGHFQDLQRRIHHLLIKGFETERDPVNMQCLLGALTVYVAEQAPSNENVTVQALRSMPVNCIA